MPEAARCTFILLPASFTYYPGSWWYSSGEGFRQWFIYTAHRVEHAVAECLAPFFTRNNGV